MENCSGLECFYAILGVQKDSSTAEIRAAYRKLAMRWHPDKCCNFQGDVREQAKLKFQAIQEAYSVLSDETRRVLYDAGLYEEVEQDPNMQDFMEELVDLMNRGSTAPSKKNADDEFEELRNLYMNMVQMNVDDPVGCKRTCQESYATVNNSEGLSPACVDVFPPPASSPPYTSRTMALDRTSPDGCCPRPHANLYNSSQSADYDFSNGFFDVSSGNFRCEDFFDDDAFTEEDEDFVATDPETHVKVRSQEWCLDLNFLIPDPAPQSCFNFDATRPAPAMQPCPEFGTSSPIGSALSPEGFCIGKTGGDSRKEHRGLEKGAKGWKKQWKGKESKAPSSWCDVCCQEKVGAGEFCFCSINGGSTDSAATLCMS